MNIRLKVAVALITLSASCLTILFYNLFDIQETNPLSHQLNQWGAPIQTAAGSLKTAFVISGTLIATSILFLAIQFDILLKHISKLSINSKNITDGNYDITMAHSGIDEISTLNLTFDQMRISLKEKNLSQESEIIEKTRAMKDILNAIDEAVFTMDADLLINNEHSTKAESMFPLCTVNNINVQELFKLSDHKTQELKSWVRMCFGQQLISKRWKTYVRLCPLQELKIKTIQGQNSYSLYYSPIIKKGKLNYIMILAKDITHERETERTLKNSESKKTASAERMHSILSNDKEHIKIFLKKAKSNKKNLYQYEYELEYWTEAQKLSLFRDVHALKNHCGVLGFNSLAKHYDKLEDMLANKSDHGVFFKKNWYINTTEINEELQEIHKSLLLLFQHSSSDQMSVSKTQYDSLIEDLSNKSIENENISNFHQRLLNLESQPFQIHLKRIVLLGNQLSQKYDKNLAELQFINGGKLLLRKVFDDINDIFIHLVHNAIDHGIESRKIRNAQGKGQGQIKFEYEEDEYWWKFSISDDGAGIDADSMFERALQLNLLSTKDSPTKLSTQQKRELAFLPGVSNEVQAGELNGRGIGLDLVKQKVASFGGKIELESKKGDGCHICIHYPKANIYNIDPQSNSQVTQIRLRS